MTTINYRLRETHIHKSCGHFLVCSGRVFKVCAATATNDGEQKEKDKLVVETPFCVCQGVFLLFAHCPSAIGHRNSCSRYAYVVICILKLTAYEH